MKKAEKSKIFKCYSRTEWILACISALFCLCAFGLFFAYGVTDSGGDGRQAYLIAFDVQVSGVHFNALAFLSYFLALVCAVLTFLPFKKRWVSLIFAVIMCFCAVVQLNMRSVYFMKYSAELTQMYIKAGVVTSPFAYLAGALSIAAAVVFILKWLYPFLTKRAEAGK